jgi:hypothetical protein
MSKFIISWADASGKRHRHLHLTSEGICLRVALEEKATRLTREEVNTWLLKIWNTPGWWTLKACNAWPEVRQV